MRIKILARLTALCALTLLGLSACNTSTVGEILSSGASPQPPMTASLKTGRISRTENTAPSTAIAAVPEEPTFTTTFPQRSASLEAKPVLPPLSPQVWRFMTAPASVAARPGEIALIVANQYDMELTLTLNDTNEKHIESIPAGRQVTILMAPGMHDWFANLQEQGRAQGTVYIASGKTGYMVFGAPFGE